MNGDAAERLAIDALAWLAEDEEILLAFLGQAGAGIDDLRARAREPEFLGFVLDHLLAHESLLMSFCEARGLAPETPMRARAALPGGDIPNWT